MTANNVQYFPVGDNVPLNNPITLSNVLINIKGKPGKVKC
jgi:hypothetical protein